MTPFLVVRLLVLLLLHVMVVVMHMMVVMVVVVHVTMAVSVLSIPVWFGVCVDVVRALKVCRDHATMASQRRAR